MLVLAMAIGVYAKVDILFWHSDGTYAKSEHVDSIYGGGVFSEGKILKEWKIVK